MFLNLVTILFLIYGGGNAAFNEVSQHQETIALSSENTVRLSVRSKIGENGNWTTHFTALGDANKTKEGWMFNVNHTFVTYKGKQLVNIEGLLAKGSKTPTHSEEVESCECAESLKKEIEKLKVELQETKTSIENLKDELKTESSTYQLKDEGSENLCEKYGSLQSNKRIKFHERTGSNVVISNRGRTVARKVPNEWRELVALTNRPLNDCDLFEVTLTKKREDFISSLEFGVAFESPAEIVFPHKVNGYDNRFLAFNDQEFQGDNVPYPSSYKVGDRFGVMKTSDGYVHFYYNGIDVGTAKRKINDTETIYGFVEVYSSALEVTLQ